MAKFSFVGNGMIDMYMTIILYTYMYLDNSVKLFIIQKQRTAGLTAKEYHTVVQSESSQVTPPPKTLDVSITKGVKEREGSRCIHVLRYLALSCLTGGTQHIRWSKICLGMLHLRLTVCPTSKGLL